MNDEPEATDRRMFEELQELVALEVKDILATAADEGFSARDVVGALELALQAEIAALAEDRDAAPEVVESGAADAAEPESI